MRNVDFGVAKVIVVLTDGKSFDYAATMREASLLKQRGFSLITVGIGLKEINITELVDMASTMNDQYLVDDFDQIPLIVSSLSKSTSQQTAPVKIDKQIEGVLEKNSYRYFRYAFENSTGPAKKKVTIILNQAEGETQLFYSFDDENPKSRDDLIDESDKRHFGVGSLKTSKDIVIPAERPANSTSEFVYFSVKGLQVSNQFQVNVSSKFIVSEASSRLVSNLSKVLYACLALLIFSILQ